MSDRKLESNKNNSSHGSYVAEIALGVLLLGVFAAITFLIQTPTGVPTTNFLKSLLSLDSVQTMWYITRAAGLTAYLLLWFSTAWGLAVSSKIMDVVLHRSFTYDFHEFLSLLAVGFIFLHIIVLMFDLYLPYSVAQILVPFLSPYRPVWVGIGVIGFYLTLLVTVTFYMRSKIGMKAFRAIHVLSLLAYLGTTVHGLMAGTDTPLLAVMAMYVATFLVVVFLMVYWLIMLAAKKNKKSIPVSPAVLQIQKALADRIKYYK